jgi:hypothetical protein
VLYFQSQIFLGEYLAQMDESYRDDDFEDSIGYEDEVCHCKKCNKEIIMRVQDNNGEVDFDPGEGRCEICYGIFCEKCGNWHTYGGKYKKICKTCFNEEVLNNFTKWHDIFEDEYCDRQCDDCPFFFKKGCMMILLEELVDMAFHTKELKQIELERLQRRNRKAEKEWENQVHEATQMAQKRIDKS